MGWISQSFIRFEEHSVPAYDLLLGVVRALLNRGQCLCHELFEDVLALRLGLPYHGEHL